MSEKQVDDLTFEEALQELAAIVEKLESEELTLEASLLLFERGQKLSTRCQKELEAATLRVEQLTADGEIAEL